MNPMALTLRIGLCLGVACPCFMAGSAYAMASKPNPYEYDLTAFKRIPPALLRYEEKPRIPVPVEDPKGLAVDARGNIYVAGSKELAILDSGGRATARFKLENPARCVAVAESGDILVGASDHVDVYGPNGEPKEQWVSLGENALLTSLAVRSGRVFVADAGTRVVWRLDGSGRLLGRIGADDRGGANKHFVIPSPYFDVAIGAQDDVWIVNPGEHLLEKYAPDGTFVSSWGRTSMDVDGFCGCCNPVHVALRPDGSFVTSEKGLPRIKTYDANGVLTAVVAGPDTLAENGPVPDPNEAGTVTGAGLDLAVDPQGRILALNSVNRVVHVYVEKAAIGESKKNP